MFSKYLRRTISTSVKQKASFTGKFSTTGFKLMNRQQPQLLRSTLFGMNMRSFMYQPRALNKPMGMDNFVNGTSAVYVD